MKNNDGLTIILPVYNEKENIKFFLNTLESNIEILHEVLIIYDFDEDNTLEPLNNILKKYENIRVIKNKSNGPKNAFLTGLEHSKYDILLISFPDEIFLINKIEKMYDLIKDGYDIVSGTRYKGDGNRIGGSKIGKIISKTANLILHYTFNFKLSDTTTAYKMFKKSVFDQIAIKTKSKNWSFIIEIMLKVNKSNLKITEVPIQSCDRVFGGTSKGNIVKSIYSYLSEFKKF